MFLRVFARLENDLDRRQVSGPEKEIGYGRGAKAKRGTRSTRMPLSPYVFKAIYSVVDSTSDAAAADEAAARSGRVGVVDEKSRIHELKRRV